MPVAGVKLHLGQREQALKHVFVCEEPQSSLELAYVAARYFERFTVLVQSWELLCTAKLPDTMSADPAKVEELCKLISDSLPEIDRRFAAIENAPKIPEDLEKRLAALEQKLAAGPAAGPTGPAAAEPGEVHRPNGDVEMASGGQVPASLTMRPVWQRPLPRPRLGNGSPVPRLPWKPKAAVLRGRGSGPEAKGAKRAARPAEELTGLGRAVEMSRGVALLAWPFLVHMLFQLTDKLNAFDGLLGRNLTMRVLVYVGSSMWLMKAALATDLRYTTRALNHLLSRVFQAAGLDGWLSEKSSEFVISVLMRVSRVTVALAALNFGFRVLPTTWELDLSSSDPYFLLLDANGDGILAASEVFHFVFDISNRLWRAAVTSVIGLCLLQLKKPPETKLVWSEAMETGHGPLSKLSKIVYAMQNPRHGELRMLARRVALGSRLISCTIVLSLFVLPWAYFFGLRPHLVFAFGGVGGLAVGLAARSFVGNLIAGLLIQLNRPFVEGDEIEDKKNKLKGVVEEIGPINTHINSLEGVMVHVPNQTLLDDVVINKSIKDFRPIEESLYVVPSSSYSLPDLVGNLQLLLDSHPSLMQEEDVKQLIQLRGGRVKLFRPLAMFDGYCDLGAKVVIYAFCRGALSRRDFKALKSQVMLSIHKCISDHGAEIGHLTGAIRGRGPRPQRAVTVAPATEVKGRNNFASTEVHKRLEAIESTTATHREDLNQKLDANKKELQRLVASLEDKIDSAGGGSAGAGDDMKKGAEAQIMKKVATRLQDFESQITSQLSTVATDFDKKLSHVHRSTGATKPIDGAGAGGDTGLDTMAEDVDQLKFDVGELKDLLTNSKGEVNHIRRIVLACERDMEDFTAAMDAVNVDLDEMRARVDATHSIITSRQRVEATMTAEISTMRLDIGDIQEALKNHDSWMEDVSNTLQQMQEKEENLSEDMINLKNELTAKLDTKVDNVAWKEANDDLDAAIKTVRDMVSSLRLDVDARRRKVDEILATVRHDITAVETNLEESKSKLAMDTDHAINALNGRIDFTNKDLAATQESLHTTQNSLSDCFNEVAVVRSDLERNVADTEARLKNDSRSKQQEVMEKIGDVEQQSELRSAESSRRLGALDLRMSGVQGGLGEEKRDILKLREEVNGLTVKSASHEVDIQKGSDVSRLEEAVKKMEKQRNLDGQNFKAQLDAIHDVLDTKVNEKPFEDVKHCVSSLTKGVVKFAQVVGVFPGPRFDDAEGGEGAEADVELLGWEESAETLSFRVDKAWRQRCSQRFRNILDMIAKKADHSVLRLLQISQQHIESQLERVKHERELWKEVVERRQQQPLQLALSMKVLSGHSSCPSWKPDGSASPLKRACIERTEYALCALVLFSHRKPQWLRLRCEEPSRKGDRLVRRPFLLDSDDSLTAFLQRVGPRCVFADVWASVETLGLKAPPDLEVRRGRLGRGMLLVISEPSLDTEVPETGPALLFLHEGVGC
ncbi:ynaI [Symbiodinium sp. CCMP2456]|nr:ynaI [Symbiodinium sp. CCMP2456]